VLDDGGTQTRSGGICIALFGPDHRVIGGSVVGVLTAAGTIQVMADFCVIENFLIYIILKFEFTKPWKICSSYFQVVLVQYYRNKMHPQYTTEF